jgi:hypothetical protein
VRTTAEPAKPSPPPAEPAPVETAARMLRAALETGDKVRQDVARETIRHWLQAPIPLRKKRGDDDE